MVAVNVVDGIKYGFRLIGYLVVVLIVAAVLGAIGQAFMPGPLGQGGNVVLAALFWLAALLVYTAGFLGLLFKVIADGVEVGTLSAEHGGGAGGMDGINPFDGGGQSPAQQRRAASQARQQQQQGGQGTRGQQRQAGAQQGGHGGTQAGGGRDQGSDAQGQQPPQDWEPGN